MDENCGLEPVAVEGFAADTDRLLASIAISMKRIADTLDNAGLIAESFPALIEGAIWNGIRSSKNQ